MKHYRTAKDTNERFAIVEEAPPANAKAVVAIDVSRRYQKILGFGGAFTEASAYNLSRINSKVRTKALKAYFDPETGLGYNMGRVSIHSCDFSLGSYSYVEDNDYELASFSIERDRRLIIPMIKDAMASGKDDIYIIASPWSPVWWMKDNRSFVRGGRLLSEYRAVWAHYYTKFIHAYENAGIPIWGITVQNEPAANQRWDSCLYTKEEERDFVRDYLGPGLERAGYGNKKLLVWDHNRDLMVERACAILSDKEAAKYVWGVAFHWYGPEDFDQVGKTHELFPDKHLLFTEGCQEGGPHFGSWETGERYGRNIIGDFNNYNEGFIDWNLFLDETGGPNHVNNLCDAPVMIKIWSEELVFQSSYYYIGHFSKFIKRGATRIKAVSDTSQLLTTAFINPDRSIVIIIMNQTEKDIPVTCTAGTFEYRIVSKKRSISTLIF